MSSPWWGLTATLWFSNATSTFRSLGPGADESSQASKLPTPRSGANLNSVVKEVSPTGRVLGIDLARFVAIVGMMAAHLLAPRSGSGPYSIGWLTALTSGLPSALFAVVGGFGVYFSSRRYLAHDQRAAAVVSLLMRGAVVMIVGFALELLPDHPIAVVLVFFGLAIACCAPLVLLPTWILVPIAMGLPFLGTVGGYGLSQVFAARTPQASSSIREAVSALFFTGYYPAVTWVAYLLVGFVAARFLFDEGQARPLAPRALLLAATGAIAFGAGRLISALAMPSAVEYLCQTYGVGTDRAQQYIAAYHRGVPLVPPPLSFALAAPHSGSPADVLVSSGVAVAVTGLLVAAFSRATSLPRVLAPFAWTGAAPLTIYSLHVALTAATWSATDAGASGGAGSWWYQSEFWGQMIIILVVGTGIGLSGKRGPLEALTSSAAQQAARRFTADP